MLTYVYVFIFTQARADTLKETVYSLKDCRKIFAYEMIYMAMWFLFFTRVVAGIYINLK